MVATPVATPPTPLARGGGQADKSLPRGGDHARFYALPGRTEWLHRMLFIGIVLLYHRDALILFDLGSTYSYASSYITPYLDVSRDSLSAPVYVPMHFDVILGMDWLSLYHAILDYHTKIVTLAMPVLSRLEWRGALDYIPIKVVSFLKAQRMVEKGCDAYQDGSADTPTI
ncbi:uncharacterized protein [Nicotiana tomentosiformis]|uniref:uncharacterized protein n=1 Tax=Nicotiana tomentosiformis TaxID=4098 RepID=UPI00388C8CC1